MHIHTIKFQVIGSLKCEFTGCRVHYVDTRPCYVEVLVRMNKTWGNVGCQLKHFMIAINSGFQLS